MAIEVLVLYADPNDLRHDPRSAWYAAQVAEKAAFDAIAEANRAYQRAQLLTREKWKAYAASEPNPEPAP